MAFPPAIIKRLTTLCPCVNADPTDAVTLGDVAMLVDYLFLSHQPLACAAEADIDQSGGPAPDITSLTMADLSLLIDYLFISGDPLPACPHL